ncbi:hypothetical protein AYO38_02035 [bacterium SCGC AG-212-C10]|nr:hypothetical protein AYO38_02035 [bacterium SCGC AG-212-C10]
MTAIPLPATWSFERAEVRKACLLVLLVAAFVSPNFGMPGSLPAVRADQLILLVLLPFLGLLVVKEPAYRRLTFADGVFLLLAIAISASIAAAPLIVPEVTWSLRDPFEVARVIEYWLMYRFALTVVPEESTTRSLLVLVFVIAIGETVFSLIQYIDGFGNHFNPKVTKYWAIGHNLVGVQRESRIVGTVGNANYYSMLSALPMILGLAVILLKKHLGKRWQWLAFAGVAMGALSMVMAQSRTAAVALLFSMFIGLILVLISRRPSAPFKAIAVWVLVLTVSIAFVEIRPPYVGTFHDRFSPFNLQDDTSATIRVARLKSFFTGFFSSEPSLCGGEKLDTLPSAGGHAVTGTIGGAPPADADAIARDVTRKADVVAITGSMLRYFCDKKAWPTGGPLDKTLVPKYLSALPSDPATNEPYPVYVDGAGFLIGAKLENPNDATGPIYTLGTLPNVVLNSSFESGGKGTPSSWSPRTDVVANVVDDAALFGTHSAHIQVGPGGDFRQFVVFDFTQGVDYTAAVWARTSTGVDQRLRLYLVGQLNNGNEIDGLWKTTVTIPGDGRWVHIQYPFKSPPVGEGRITTLQFMLRAETQETNVDVQVDGATLTQGTFAPSYVKVSDTDPAKLRPTNLPQFSDSPFIGVGPRNNAEAGAFDNEYALFLDRYGLAGFVPYILMYVAAIVIAVRAWRRNEGLMPVLALGLLVFTIGLFVFNLGAGSYYHFQIMAIYWLLLGYLAARKPGSSPGSTVREPAEATTPSLATGGASAGAASARSSLEGGGSS